jgi:redox-sensing transcriptional repressor
MDRAYRIPVPVIERLCRLYEYLCSLEKSIDDGVPETVSSAELERRIGIKAHTIRKDLGFVRDTGAGAGGYGVTDLRDAIGQTLGFNERRRTCVVGLGRIGSAVLQFPGFLGGGYEMTAGFDGNVNLVEVMNAPAPLYPAYEIPERVSELEIELAVLTVPGDAAQSATDRLVEGRIRGIVNFTPERIRVPKSVWVRDVDVMAELRAITALIHLSE